MAERFKMPNTVYMYVNRANGKRYIGVTNRTLTERSGSDGRRYKECTHFWKAIQKYGWSAFEPHIMRDDLSKEDADLLEKQLIRHFRTCDSRFGYNIQKGGRSAGGLSEEGRAALIAKQSGANAYNARPVIIFDASGKRVERFDTTMQACEYLGCSSARIVRACSSHPSTVKGFFAYYEDDVLGLLQLPKSEICNPKHTRSERRKKPVSQYDLSGNYVSDFPSATDAAETLGINASCICSALIGYDKSAGGFLWKYSDGSSQNINPYNRTFTNKKVEMIDPKTGKRLSVFESAKEAASRFGIEYSSLCRCARGINKTAGGYIWRYV